MSGYQTEQRQKLLMLFQNAGHKSLSVSEIMREFNNEDISLSAVYRNLKKMENDGLICKVNDSKKAEAHYHYVNPSSCVGIIHLKCEICGETFHLNKHISNLIFSFAKDENNFFVNDAAAFLHGKCENCSQILTR